MCNNCIGQYVRFVLVGCWFALVFASKTVLAETPVPTSTSTTVAAGSTATVNYWFLFWTLLFALLALVVVFVYTYFIQKEFYTTARGLGRLGKTVKVKSVPTFLAATTGLESMAVEPSERLQITGPAAITVGVESPEFSVVRLQDGEVAAEDAKWAVEPANAATVQPESGAKVKVIAALPGAFTLIAQVSQPKPGEARLPVAAIAPQVSPVELPFVGQAYGSIAIALVLIAAVIILGLSSILSGEGAATLLGALLGYIFGVTKSGASNPATGGQPAA